MMAEDASRRQFVEGAVVAGAAVTILPGAASAKDQKVQTDKGFVDPRTYGKDFFKTPYVRLPFPTGITAGPAISGIMGLVEGRRREPGSYAPSLGLRFRREHSAPPHAPEAHHVSYTAPRLFGTQIGIFDQRGDCSRKSNEYTGLPAGNENDEMCVVVKYKSVPTNIDAAKAVFASFGNSR